MTFDKNNLRAQYLKRRKKKHLLSKKFKFNLIFRLIKKNFNNKKIVIGCYYPANYEVNILNFIEEASKKNFKIALPVVESLTLMRFRPWVMNEPLYVSKFGILEPEMKKKRSFQT